MLQIADGVVGANDKVFYVNKNKIYPCSVYYDDDKRIEMYAVSGLGINTLIGSSDSENVFIQLENAEKKLAKNIAEQKEMLLNKEYLFQTLFEAWYDGKDVVSRELMVDAIKENFGIDVPISDFISKDFQNKSRNHNKIYPKRNPL